MIPINDLTRDLDDQMEIFDSIKQVIRSGKWIFGEEHDAFEHDLAKFIGTRYALGVANGTDALEIALRAVGCGPGSKIITVANAGGYASIAASAIGCEVIYCDIDAIRLVMDPHALRNLLSDEISVVVVTHLYGNVAPISAIVEMCRIFNIKVVEDCAQAIGASEDGRLVGSIGDIGTFSFFPTKNLGAIGDGGAVTTDSAIYAENIRKIRQYGWDEKYRIQEPGGMNSRLDEIQAAILRVRFQKLLFNNEKRRQILVAYNSAIINSGLKLMTSFSQNSAAHLAVFLFPDRNTRNEFREFFETKEIKTDIHYPILDCNQEGFKNAPEHTELVISKSIIERLVTIPLFPSLSENEVKHITNSLSEFIQRAQVE